ncbi:MAG: KEOPS complex N(6)-L-threonylcarbamoyladenine synthase Kae1 [Candidatus Micrarchaeia archaeon]
MTICLGIESTAHTIGVGIFDSRKKKVLANERKTFPESGIHPRKAADFQSEEFGGVFNSALERAGVELNDVDIVAFSQGPGLGACLRISCVAARALALMCGKPVVGVNHCVAHIEISKFMTGAKDPLVVYVSGGNTQIIVGQKERRGSIRGLRYHVIGETLDTGIGNFLDVFAREIGEKDARDVERLASQGRNFIQLPYTVKGMDLIFGGLLTESIKKFKEGVDKENLCFSVQETAYSMLCEAAERALALTGKKEVVVCGGVAQNRRLQTMLKIVANDWGCKFGVAPNEFNGDNGAMIAYVGCLLGKKRTLKLREIIPIQKFRTDAFVI